MQQSTDRAERSASRSSLLEFARYVEIRNSRTDVTGYAVGVHREDLFAEGGMPIISGLSRSPEVERGHRDFLRGFRVLDPTCLPLDEQYRFVAFCPTRHSRFGGGELLDWTHEREWRWPEQDYVSDSDPTMRIDGYPLAGSGRSSDRGLSQGRFVFIVERDRDVPRIVKACAAAPATHDEVTAPPWQYCRCVVDTRVLSLETAQREYKRGCDKYARIETYPE